MRQIILYVLILILGATLVRKKLIPSFIKKRLGILQTISLFILLGTMGYKIGINETIIKNFKNIGFQASIFAISTCVFSVLITFILFKISKIFLKKSNIEKRG
ncbi:hypothetical protein [Fusobacterium sp. IOR10]|uniref:hypothetical protein n=1 Tax=Fusobacterium sp. IOR10 TaxID=2665157 RepID=UPI00193F8379|nr:hypothetical protein [Fusobacterium sp. IOR10]